MNEDTILGLSPGSRFTGIAVVRSGILVHSQVRSFPGVWSDSKLHAILNFIAATIKRHGVSQVTVKVPDVLPLTKSFHQLIGSINVLCERKGIRPRYYSRSEITACHLSGKHITRKDLMAAMVLKHPELMLEYKREMENTNAHYYRVFEAVAAAHAYRNNR